MVNDSEEWAKRYDKCQHHSTAIHLPATELSSIVAPYLFMKYFIHVVGPLPTAPNQKRYMLFVTDYFSKWFEAEAYSNIQDIHVEKFIWKNIICRFGVPKEIVMDNG